MPALGLAFPLLAAPQQHSALVGELPVLDGEIDQNSGKVGKVWFG